MRKSKKLVYLRRFLNREGDYGLASVLAELSFDITDRGTPDPYFYGEARFEISDCDRIIKLAVPTSNEDDFRLSKRKIGILIDALMKMDAGLDEYRKAWRAFNKERNRKRKALKKQEAKQKT